MLITILVPHEIESIQPSLMLRNRLRLCELQFCETKKHRRRVLSKRDHVYQKS